jgi:hypothetical protein
MDWMLFFILPRSDLEHKGYALYSLIGRFFVMERSKFSEEYIASLRRNDGLWRMSVVDLQHNLRDTRLELADVLEYIARGRGRRSNL